MIQEKEDLLEEKTYWERVVIVDDCRYVNELNMGSTMQATPVFLSYGNRKVSKDAWRSHPSELLANAVEDGCPELNERFPWVIANDLTEEIFVNTLKAWAPLWCGLSVESHDLSDPDEFRFLSKDPDYMDESIKDLLDLLDFNFPEDKEEEDDG